MQEASQSGKLKYNIKERLQRMPGVLRNNIYKLCMHCDISQSTLYNWSKIETGDKNSIPSDQYYLIAEFFKCNPDELKNG